jgi:tRNA-specific 2-thiouridylase
LAHAVFPLGDSTKQQVRAEAARRGLSVADKPDSHDICFISDGDTQGFLRKQLGERPGQIVDGTGDVLGTHDGTFGFTVGQRKGLKLTTPTASGEPRYVLAIQPKSNTVVVGSARDLEVDLIRCERAVWTNTERSDDFSCLVQMRAHGMVSAADITFDGSGDSVAIVATLRQVQRGVAAGQALVMYDGDRVIGSATITSARRRENDSATPQGATVHAAAAVSS